MENEPNKATEQTSNSRPHNFQLTAALSILLLIVFAFAMNFSSKDKPQQISFSVKDLQKNVPGNKVLLLSRAAKTPDAPLARPEGGEFNYFPVFELQNRWCQNGYKISTDGKDPIKFGRKTPPSPYYSMGIIRTMTVKVACIDANYQISEISEYKYRINLLEDVNGPVMSAGMFEANEPVNSYIEQPTKIPVEVTNVPGIENTIKVEYRITGFPTQEKGIAQDRFHVLLFPRECHGDEKETIQLRQVQARFVMEYTVPWEPHRVFYEPFTGFTSYSYREYVCGS